MPEKENRHNEHTHNTIKQSCNPQHSTRAPVFLTYSAGSLRGHLYMELSGPVSKTEDKPRWYASLILWPAQQDHNSLFHQPKIRALSTSTSSLQQLWNHWLRTCYYNYQLY